MRNRAAHALRWLARRAIALSNQLDPVREAAEQDFAEWVGVDLGWRQGRTESPISVTYRGGPEGPAARKVRLTGSDGSSWDISAPDASGLPL